MATSQAYIEEQIARFEPGYAERFREFVRSCLDRENDLRTEAALDRYAAMIPDRLPDPVRLTLLYDALRRYVSYDYDETNAARYTYPAALFTGRAVCIGIADLFSILCQRTKLDCRVIVGYGDSGRPGGGGLHAWDLVRIALDDGPPRFYHCDPTWDLGRGKRRYFLRSDTDMGKDHYWRRSEYPLCPRSAEHIPTIPDKAVDLACLGFKKACKNSD